MNLIHRIKHVEQGWFYIRPGYGADLDTLVKRASYGGRKGRRAVLRINRHSRKLYPAPELPVVTESAPWLVTPASLPDAI